MKDFNTTLSVNLSVSFVVELLQIPLQYINVCMGTSIVLI